MLGPFEELVERVRRMYRVLSKVRELALLEKEEDAPHFTYISFRRIFARIL